MQAAEFHMGVEKLSFKLSPLVWGDFRPARETIYRCESTRILQKSTWSQYSRRDGAESGMPDTGAAGYIRLLARLAGQCPSTAVFLYARPYEALGNEFSHLFGAGMTQVMQAVE
jgi:hypothetical protein